MSGPVDRSPRDPDREWPAEDIDQARGGEADRWSSPDTSRSSPGDPSVSPDWDDWPPITPPGEYDPDEPLPPSSDPWAESWEDEAATGSPLVAPADRAQPAAETRWEPAEPDLPAPPAPPPPEAPAWTSDARDARATELVDEVAPRETDSVPSWSSPWRPDSGPDWMAEAIEEPQAEAEPIPPVWMPPEPEPEPEPEPIPEPEPEPIPEPEPEPEPIPEPEPEPVPEPEPIPEPEPGPEPEPEPIPEPEQVREPEPEPDELWARPPEREPEAGVYSAGEPTQVFPSSWAPPPPARDAPLDPAAGSVRTSFGPRDAEAAEAVAIDQPAIAEQAVPWLIGVILLLAGMVIVLLALIFAGDASLGGAASSPSGLAGIGGSGDPSPGSGIPQPSRTPAPSVSTTPTPVPLPEYGALELVYQGRSAALAPIYLLRRDFTVEGDPVILAQDPGLDIRRFTWARDGTVGAALIAEVLVSVEPGAEKRSLGEEISTATFGSGATPVYAVRVTQDGADDTATVLAVDFVSGESAEIGRVTYARPQIAAEAALQEAKFADDGGTVRLYWLEDETLHLWVLGGGSWQVDPESGDITEISDELPVLWAPDGDRRITATEEGTTTTLELVEDGEVLATMTVDMLVSHLRWSRDGQRVIFTGGQLASGGGVLQDLFLWDPEEDADPVQLTSTGANFGAEWMGAQPLWRPAE